MTRVLITAVGGLLALAVCAVVAVVLVIPAVTGGAARTVESGSMAPALPVGSVVVERPVHAAELRIGDIATYAQRTPVGTRYVTHRVVAVQPGGFVFRGDANPVPDPDVVPASAIRGRVWFHVPWLGTLRAELAELRLLLLAAGALCLGAYAVVRARAGLRAAPQEAHR